MEDDDTLADKANAQIKEAVSQCRSMVSNYRSLIAANTNTPELATEPFVQDISPDKPET